MTRLLIIMAVTLAGIAGSTRVAAQDAPYKFDAGGGIGMSGYLGDVNGSNMFKHPGIAAHLSGRYIFDARWAVRASLSLASLSGDSEDFDMIFPDRQSFSFKSTVYDLGFRGEFNFFSFGMGETYKRLRRWSPYLAIGIGASMSKVEDGTYVALSVPMAFGLKLKLTKRLNVMAEFSVSKIFGDHADGKEIADLYTIKSSFLKNNDWTSALTFSFSYEFGERCSTCHYVE